MNASKENASKALQIVGLNMDERDDAAREFLREFLEAAAKRLPSEAALARDRSRPRTKRASARLAASLKATTL